MKADSSPDYIAQIFISFCQCWEIHITREALYKPQVQVLIEQTHYSRIKHKNKKKEEKGIKCSGTTFPKQFILQSFETVLLYSTSPRSQHLKKNATRSKKFYTNLWLYINFLTSQWLGPIPSLLGPRLYSVLFSTDPPWIPVLLIKLYHELAPEGNN